jgi:large subunit ribosomal protein LP2
MKVVAAYLLAVLGGNTCPTAEDLKHILGSGNLFFPSPHYVFLFPLLDPYIFFGKMIGFLVFGLAVGADADDDRIELLLSSVKGKDITELIASGREKLASVPSGGGVAVAAGGAPAAASGGAAPAAEAKKEEKVEEKEESDDVSAIFHFRFHLLYL